MTVARDDDAYARGVQAGVASATDGFGEEDGQQQTEVAMNKGGRLKVHKSRGKKKIDNKTAPNYSGPTPRNGTKTFINMEPAFVRCGRMLAPMSTRRRIRNTQTEQLLQ